MEKLYKCRKNIKWKKLFIMTIYMIGIYKMEKVTIYCDGNSV